MISVSGVEETVMPINIMGHRLDMLQVGTCLKSRTWLEDPANPTERLGDITPCHCHRSGSILFGQTWILSFKREKNCARYSVETITPSDSLQIVSKSSRLLGSA